MKIAATTLGFLLSASAFAQSAAPAAEAAPAAVIAVPTPDEIKKVLDYQENGKAQGPVLLDFIPCLKVDKEKGPTQFQCVEPVTAAVKKNTVVNMWLQFFSPKDGKYDDMTVQFSLNGTVWKTNEVLVSTPGKTRTWTAATLNKPGKWTIKLLRGTTELATSTVTAE